MAKRAAVLWLTAALVSTLVACGGRGGEGPTSPPDVIALPAGFQPEGIASSGDVLFVGSIPSGRVFRASATTGQGSVLIESRGARNAIGMKVDGRGRLFVAGGATGQAYVYDANTGADIVQYDLVVPPVAGTFINDVVVTPQAAWFTDSGSSNLHRVDIGPDGTLSATATPIQMSGVFPVVGGQFNANGIAATPDGATLLVVNSFDRSLFRVDTAMGASQRVVIDGGAALPNGDGLLLEGQTLFVVQNQSNQLAVLTLSPDFSTAATQRVLTNAALDVPTTVAASGESLYVVNARFGIANPEAASYSVIRLARP
ncbi:MAG: SMP-30/gluconolactonase/LRE family protein [Deltaproteobacteria bacterium]|nr:SMP-30/gluconolactonase/LRE family protein [Deltaproteobacteria bacterium]